MTKHVPLILASQSPRRSQLLRDAGIAHEQRSPPFSDPDQPPDELRGHNAEDYAASLAEQKALSLAAVLTTRARVLAADTICVDAHGVLIGKPTDLNNARAMLKAFMNTDHRVVTGVALLQPALTSDAPTPQPACFADTTTVRFGGVGDDELDAYLASGGWQGKAGGYNLFDRQAAGWPIRVVGDPTTVVGLPMRRLMPLLAPRLNSDP